MKWLGALALSLLSGIGVAHANTVDARDPLTIIEETTTQILQTLNDRRDEFTENPSELQAVVREDLLPLIDLNYSARLILGRAGRDASAEQLDAFSEAMTLGFAYTYLNGGSADIRQSGALRGDLVGDYKRNDIHVIAANANWRW